MIWIRHEVGAALHLHTQTEPVWLYLPIFFLNRTLPVTSKSSPTRTAIPSKQWARFCHWFLLAGSLQYFGSRSCMRGGSCMWVHIPSEGCNIPYHVRSGGGGHACRGWWCNIPYHVCAFMGRRSCMRGGACLPEGSCMRRGQACGVGFMHAV